MPSEEEVREQVARRAYELYLARGREPGHDVEDWLQAEAEITAGGGPENVPTLAMGPNVPRESRGEGERGHEVMTRPPDNEEDAESGFSAV